MAQPVSQKPERDRIERRSFLGGIGMLACSGSAALAGRLVAPPSADAAGDSEDQQAAEQPAGLEAIQKLLQGKEPVTWIFTGDSITHGALHTEGWRSYPEHFAERVRWELRRVRDVVINTGISGERTGGLLADLDWRALRFKPNVVSVMIGMNDCAAGPGGRDMFRQNLTAIIERVQAADAQPLLNTPNTIYVENAKNRADLPAYAEIVRELAKQRNLALVDHWTHWEKTKPKQDDLLPWLQDKSIHPGVYGHREFAKLIFRELGIFDPASPTCRLEVP